MATSSSLRTGAGERRGVSPVDIGIDLAWNVRGRTGLAAVDVDGGLVASTSVRSDAEIDAWLAPYAGSLAAVAIDAPVVVTNAKGMRDCEREVARRFGRFHAGCHPSNLGMSYMDPPRAWVLAERHGWDTDPQHRPTPGAPGAIEVFPHPATVVLFGLDRILKYKHGPVETRRVSLLRLLDLLETLGPLRLGRHHRWGEIRGAVEAARRPVSLDVVEDEVDAILCAHLAWLWRTDPGSMEVVGGCDGGAIVVPVSTPH